MTQPPTIEYAHMLAPQRRESAPIAWLRWLGWIFIWTFFGAIVVAAVCGALGTGILPALGYLTPVGAILILTAGAILSRGARRTRDLSILAYVEQAVRLNLPLPPMLKAAAASETKPMGRRLRQLSERLGHGGPLAQSLAAVAPSLPPRVLGLVSAGENSGQLAPALRRIVAGPGVSRAPNPSEQIFYRWYPLILLAVGCLVLTMLGTFVMPKFRQIRVDFQMPAPDPFAMRWMMAASDWVAPALVVCTGLFIVVYTGRMLAYMFTARVPTVGPLRGLVDWMLWLLPVLRPIARNRAMADACHVIADALAAGLPFHSAIHTAAQVPNNSVMQRRLNQWALQVAGGMPPGESARRASMPALVSGMLDTSHAGGEAAEVFVFLARYYDSRFSRAAALARGALVPALAIGFGILVALVALSIFQPMVELINHLPYASERM